MASRQNTIFEIDSNQESLKKIRNLRIIIWIYSHYSIEFHNEYYVPTKFATWIHLEHQSYQTQNSSISYNMEIINWYNYGLMQLEGNNSQSFESNLIN